MSKLFLFLFVAGLASCSSQSNKTLYVYTSMQEEIAQDLLRGFEEDSGIRTQFVRLSTGEAAARIEAERNNPQASLWLGGVALGHAEAKAKALTMPYQSPKAQNLVPPQRDPDHHWAGLYMAVLSFVSNTRELERFNLEAPRTWSDLLKPEYRNRIQFANPATSGTSYNLITSLIAKHGEEAAFQYMRSVHPNVSQYTRSGSAPTNNVVIGETAVAIGYSHDILKIIHETQAPLKITYPTDGTGYEVAAISLIQGARNLDQAKKLYDWLLGSRAAAILAKHYITPLNREGIELRDIEFPPTDLELIDVDPDWAGEHKRRIVEHWNQSIRG